jgi:soluble lytic murein transglycosylase-like protein
MTKQAAMSAGSALLLALLLSGCSTSSMRPSSGAAAVAAIEAEEGAAPVAAAEAEEGDEALSMVTAFAAPIVPAADAAQVTPRPALDPLIAKYSAHYAVPERLVRRVIVRESRYNPAARNGPYYGLMQISHATAGTMGYRGNAGGLLDADTNLRYAVKYLAGAYMVARGNEDQAVRFYARGYYYDAKRMGLLEETGLR